MLVSEKYDSIIKIYNEKLEHSSFRQDSEEYQTLLTTNLNDLLKFKSIIVDKMGLFSVNENIDDLSTKSLKYLSMDYYLGLMLSKRQMPSTSPAHTTTSQLQNTDIVERNKFKLDCLKSAIQSFIAFLILLQNYSILDDFLSKKINSFENKYNPKLNELYSSNKDITANAQLKRDQKIEIFKRNKELSSKLKLLESKLHSHNQSEDDLNDSNEELLRDLYVEQLKSLSYKSFNEIEQILMESELLLNFIKMGPEDPKKVNGDREKQDKAEFTDRLESLDKPLLSETGKILRNFTLIDQRTKLQNKVKGYGQYGPTMTVEEFLDKEWEEGRVLQGGEDELIREQQRKEDMEDNYKWNDEETYKAREWDEFKEANPKGSGNTMNRG
ncbi:Tap42p NDAI_0B01440 [Naumovozyma dairenensis CBS 421]|uniref:TAP42-like protein n=1 Tax=Naumovozyma dairenensis (strain ATCC 10597 / BCRC 20456 / CBS 421 / NBRC 0211 / NRRL Y-12639) TaxID=1071378 RepID=G0W5W7_NAUDC|nr:hypothetical protein NDAI_0B01440 [Naumovozyma dairenensis CBS 421]CCD23178.1 hypothetical protein NDAI_0B01440 [Naumovozyma dairenensis CBS 421]